MSIVNDRNETHGDPVANMEAVAREWSPVLGVEVNAKQVCSCMVALHNVRHRNAPVVDPSHLEHAEGYREIIGMIEAKANLDRRLP